MDIELQPTISYHAMVKAEKTLQPFVTYYFHLHGLTEADFMKYLAVLTYTEATIYQIDEEYELNVGKEGFKSRHEQILFEILERKGLLDDKIRQEFANGIIYYGLEHKMCSGRPFVYEEIVKANMFKCYDFNILHRLLFKLLGKPYDENMLSGIWIDEMLVDVEDDIRQYQDDMRRNVYNTYRMLVKLYGKEGKKKLEEYVANLMKQIGDKVAQAPPEMAAKLQGLWDGYRSASPVPPIPEPILEH